MKRLIVTLLMAALAVFCTGGCGNSSSGTENPTDTAGSQGEAVQSTDGTKDHKIGVAVYDVMDDEVIAFREYLKDYIEECYPEVEFFYSYSIRSKEEEMQFLEDAYAAGVEGVMSFITYDLPAEVAYCESQKIYYMMASGTVSEEQFAAVEDNPYFLGVVGPGNEIEYQAGADMAEYFINETEGDSYILFTGGAGMGNEMHRLRSLGALETFEKEFGDLGQSPEELAVVSEPVKVEAGELHMTVFPGYTTREETGKAAAAELKETKYDNVLAMFSMYSMADELKKAGVQLGIVDSYNTTNKEMYASGILNYVTGKYSSIVGPSFAAMYNAVTGYADEFREDGKAFLLTQGFWTSDNADDYNDKYALATGIYLNAYNYEDLGSVMKVYDDSATFERLKALTEAYTYEEAEARRAE